MTEARQLNALTPAAMGDPGGWFIELEQGRYGRIVPKTSANPGFTLIARVKPGTQSIIREYGTGTRSRRR